MVWQYNPLVWLPIGVMLIATALAIHGWRWRHLSSHRLGFHAASLTIVWAMTYALQLSSADLNSAYFWMAAQMIGPLVLPLLWFVVAYRLCFPNARLGSGTILLLGAVPAVSAVLLFLPGLGGPMAAQGWMASWDGVQVLHVIPGPFYRVHLAYTYALISSVIVILALHARALAPAQRRQATIMLLVVLLSILVNILYAVGWLPWQRLQPATLAAMVAQLLFLWGILSTPLVDIRPIARERVIEAMRDGLLMIDLNQRLVDVSPSAAIMLDIRPSNVLGDTIEHALARWPELAAICQMSTTAIVELDLPPVGPLDPPRWIEVRIQPLADQHERLLGRIAILRDITVHRLAEQEQHDLIAELQKALAEVKTLQGLLPVCAWCGKIRGEAGHWSTLDDYVETHYDAAVTHGICPTCAARFGNDSDVMAHEEAEL